MIPICVSSETPVTCLYCGYMLERGFGSPAWVHARNGDPACPPTYAAPVFSDDPIWTLPRDIRELQGWA